MGVARVLAGVGETEGKWRVWVAVGGRVYMQMTNVCSVRACVCVCVRWMDASAGEVS